jgi:hypothetical protein
MQKYNSVIIPKMEKAFENIGAKFMGDPDVAIIYAGVSEMHNLLTTFYAEGTQLKADHVEAVQEKQELDEKLLLSVAELSVQTEKVKGLSKKAIQDVNTYLKSCTTIIVDEETERKASDFMTLQVSLRMNSEAVNTKILKRESEIEREKHKVKLASAKLPTLVMENAVLHKLKRLRARKELNEVKRLCEEAKRKRQMEALKQASRVAKLKQAVESSAHSTSLLDCDDDDEAPHLAGLFDDEAVEDNDEAGSADEPD